MTSTQPFSRVISAEDGATAFSEVQGPARPGADHGIRRKRDHEDAEDPTRRHCRISVAHPRKGALSPAGRQTARGLG